MKRSSFLIKTLYSSIDGTSLFKADFVSNMTCFLFLATKIMCFLLLLLLKTSQGTEREVDQISFQPSSVSELFVYLWLEKDVSTENVLKFCIV